MEFSQEYLYLVGRVKLINSNAAEYMLNGAVRDADKIDLNTDTAYLVCAFAWCETPQGSAYWGEINSRLIDGIRDKQGETMKDFCSVSGNTILLDKGEIYIQLPHGLAYNITFGVRVEQHILNAGVVETITRVVSADTLEGAMAAYDKLVDEVYEDY